MNIGFLSFRVRLFRPNIGCFWGYFHHFGFFPNLYFPSFYSTLDSIDRFCWRTNQWKVADCFGGRFPLNAMHKKVANKRYYSSRFERECFHAVWFQIGVFFLKFSMPENCCSYTIIIPEQARLGPCSHTSCPTTSGRAMSHIMFPNVRILAGTCHLKGSASRKIF